VFNNASSANGDVAPNRIISGAQTMLESPYEIIVNPYTDELFVVNSASNSVLIFANASTIDGDVSPARTISGPATSLLFPWGIALDVTRQ
jgi:DNA-binding beta-propeller fold protein YncE